MVQQLALDAPNAAITSYPLVLIPTYNERDNLPILAAGVLAQPGYRILVVDDGSPDGTGQVADELVQVALRAATRDNVTVVVADLQKSAGAALNLQVDVSREDQVNGMAAETMKALGLQGIGRTTNLPDTKDVRGMLHNVSHLITVEPGEELS